VTSIRIRQQVIDDVTEHARAEAPNECCGLLVGTHAEIEEVVRARNALQSPTRFYLDPADHFEAIRLARRTGRIVCGSYHSHPKGPSHPSATDAEQLDDPDMILIIVSLAAECDPEGAALHGDGTADGRPERAALRTRRGPVGPALIGVFRWTDGNFARIDFVPVP
jgi:proteasome lid subunit RPN8/RPN11